jgi:hypothetical protein
LKNQKERSGKKRRRTINEWREGMTSKPLKPGSTGESGIPYRVSSSIGVIPGLGPMAYRLLSNIGVIPGLGSDTI